MFLIITVKLKSFNLYNKKNKHNNNHLHHHLCYHTPSNSFLTSFLVLSFDSFYKSACSLEDFSLLSSSDYYSRVEEVVCPYIVSSLNKYVVCDVVCCYDSLSTSSALSKVSEGQSDEPVLITRKRTSLPTSCRYVFGNYRHSPVEWRSFS